MNNIVLIVIAAVGAWLFFDEQIKSAWVWLKEKTDGIKTQVTPDESGQFGRIRALIRVAEEAERLGVPTAGGELRKAASNELLKPEIKADE